MKTDKELLISGIKKEMDIITGQFNKLFNQDYDIISDDQTWTKLKELKSLYDDYQLKLYNIDPPSDDIPF